MANPSNKIRGVAYYFCPIMYGKSTGGMLKQDITLKKIKGETCHETRERFFKAAEKLQKIKNGCTNKYFSGKVEIEGCKSKAKSENEKKSWLSKLFDWARIADHGPFELP